MTRPLTESEFATAFTQSQRVVYGYIRSLTGDADAPDEVFAETNLALWKNREKFAAGTNFAAWACTRARFQVLAYFERAGRDRMRFSSELVGLLADEGIELAESADQRLVALRVCLGEMSDDHRKMLEQRYAGTHSVDEIAKQFNRSANSLSVTLHRLRHRLVNCIETRLADQSEDDA